MADTVKVILDLSDDVQAFLERQHIDLYREIQQEFPAAELEVISDPNAPAGSRDLITILVVTTALVSALTPVIIRILNQFKPDSIDLEIKETETRSPDGSITFHRTYVYTKREYHQQAQLQQPLKLDLPQSGDSTNQKNG